MGLFIATCKIIVALIFPPLAVGIETGLSWELLISIMLTILGWIPGMNAQWSYLIVGIIYAIYIIYRF
jgi:uncharacterized membrane protein YqaE (UPF0057 family)